MKSLTMFGMIGFFAWNLKSATAQPAAPDNDMKTVLKRTVDSFDAANTQRQKNELSDRLGLISSKWSNEWITHYYLAYSKAVLSKDAKLEDAKRDALLDQADTETQKALTLLGKENDEIHVLEALIASSRIGISPMMRNMTYGKVFKSNIKAAKDLNPGNPRIYFLQGVAWFGMPSFVGGGKEVALPYLAKADSLYRKESDADILKPYWGSAATDYYLKQCKAKTKN